MAFALGVDFGTSTTVAALRWPDGRVRPLLFDASPLLPSAVFVGPDSPGLLTGVDAEQAAVSFPGGLEPNPKRRVDDGTVWLGDRELAIVDVFTAVFERVAAEAFRVAGERPDDIVLTHPAKWSAVRIAVLAAAAARAGLSDATLVAEPVAAAAYFRTSLGHRVAPGGGVVVYDLGAGTFDVSVVRATAGGFEVVGADGLDEVGGLEFDAAFVAHLRLRTADAADAWKRLDWPSDPDDALARLTLWRRARQAKEQLSRHPTTTVRVPVVGVNVTVTRAEFDDLARPIVARTTDLTLSVLRDAGVPREAIAGLVLVGGSSRIPLVAAELHRTLGIAPAAIEQPELVVAEGSLSLVEPPPAALTPVAPPSPPRRIGRRAVIAAAGVTSLAAVAAAAGAFSLTRDRDDQTARPLRRAAVTGLRFVTELTGHDGSILDLAFDRHGGDLIATGSNDQTFRLWSRGNRGPVGGPITFGPPNTAAYVRGVSFSPDGTLLATCGNGPAARIWTVAGRAEAGPPLGGHAIVVYHCLFSPDGRTLATGDSDGAIRLWNAADHTLIGAPLLGHVDNVYGLAWHPTDNNVLASGGADDTVRFWDVGAGRQLGATLTGHTANVGDVAFDPTGRLLLSSDSDGFVRMWDVPGRRQVGDPLAGAGVPAFSPDGTVFATGGRYLRLWNTDTREPVGSPMTDGSAPITMLAFSPDGATLAGAVGEAVFLWDVV